MRLISLELESRIRNRGLWPETRVAWAALYVVALDVMLFAVQMAASRFRPSMAASLTGWVTFLSVLAVVLLLVVGIRWMRTHLLWRLRNRLIVTYIFIGVIPVILLLVISLTSLYLFARQFAGFVVTSDVTSHLHSMEASNRAIARALVNQFERAGKSDAAIVAPIRPRRTEWMRREVCVWYRDQTAPNCVGPEGSTTFAYPHLSQATLGTWCATMASSIYAWLRSVSEPEALRVITSEALDRNLIEQIAGDLGQITFSPDTRSAASGTSEAFSAGSVPPATRSLDFQIAFPVPVQVVDWTTGERQREGALARIETRPSVLYDRLFGALGDYARGVELILWSIAVIFAVIEILALWIGTKLTRSITSSVADIYGATTHINRGDFSHRIAVKSSDQLAALATSFNSMTNSISGWCRNRKRNSGWRMNWRLRRRCRRNFFRKKFRSSSRWRCMAFAGQRAR